jgi:hypothetical protein
MFGRIPAPCQIDPAAHGKAIVDHNNFLVVAASGRMRAIKLESRSRASRPTRQRPARFAESEIV